MLIVIGPAHVYCDAHIRFLGPSKDACSASHHPGDSSVFCRATISRHCFGVVLDLAHSRINLSRKLFHLRLKFLQRQHVRVIFVQVMRLLRRNTPGRTTKGEQMVHLKYEKSSLARGSTGLTSLISSTFFSALPFLGSGSNIARNFNLSFSSRSMEEICKPHTSESLVCTARQT